MNIIISESAVQNGFGSDVYMKRVTNLTADERKAVINGEIVVYNSGAKAGGKHGTTWRQVYRKGREFVPRVPSAAVIAQLEA